MKKVLYVDDAKSMQKLVSLVLKGQFELTFADDGQQGLDAIELQNFDLIISDVNMPIMGGLEFLGKLRQHNNSRFTPTLMLTTEASQELKNQGKALGATGWIVKPFEPTKLVDIIKRVLN